MRFSFITNLGAYTTTSGAFINFRATAPMTGLYDVPLAYGRNQMFLTNTAPMAAYRGAGRPIMSAMIERLVGQAAREMKIDPAELRRRNMIPKERFPYKLVNGSVYDSGNPLGVLADATSRTRWPALSCGRMRSNRRSRASPTRRVRALAPASMSMPTPRAPQPTRCRCSSAPARSTSSRSTRRNGATPSAAQMLTRPDVAGRRVRC